MTISALGMNCLSVNVDSVWWKPHLYQMIALEVCQSWPAPKLVPVPGQKSVECVEAVTSERTGGGVLERQVFHLQIPKYWYMSSSFRFKRNRRQTQIQITVKNHSFKKKEKTY